MIIKGRRIKQAYSCIDPEYPELSSKTTIIVTTYSVYSTRADNVPNIWYDLALLDLKSRKKEMRGLCH